MDMQEPLVQPIAVSRNRGSHEEVVIAVALASVQAWLNDADNPIWNRWLSGRFTKSVRRGTPTQVLAATQLSQSFVRIGEVEACGFTPMHYSEMPECLTKMQVSHFERERMPVVPGVYRAAPLGPMMYVNEDVGMSTGKMAAQVAHGLMAWVIRRSDEERREWVKHGYQFSLFGTRASTFIRQIGGSEILIEDAGLTEVAANTATVLVT